MQSLISPKLCSLISLDVTVTSHWITSHNDLQTSATNQQWWGTINIYSENCCWDTKKLVNTGGRGENNPIFSASKATLQPQVSAYSIVCSKAKPLHPSSFILHPVMFNLVSSWRHSYIRICLINCLINTRSGFLTNTKTNAINESLSAALICTAGKRWKMVVPL